MVEKRNVRINPAQSTTQTEPKDRLLDLKSCQQLEHSLNIIYDILVISSRHHNKCSDRCECNLTSFQEIMPDRPANQPTEQPTDQQRRTMDYLIL